jgi:putative transposase
MPRAHRYFLPGHVWHITHRCHQKEFLLKFARDRDRWRHWLFEARKRYGLCVLNYIVTSNHIHLLVLDRGNGEIARSMQLIAGRTAQEYNQRKHRKGAYWEDRYHATAVDTEDYLARCIAYIDLNMVRAGVVSHPSEWHWSGYREIQTPGQRYKVINNAALLELFNIHSLKQFQTSHRAWIEAALETITHVRAPMWSQSLAIGHKGFVENVQTALGINANHRNIRD